MNKKKILNTIDEYIYDITSPFSLGDEDDDIDSAPELHEDIPDFRANNLTRTLFILTSFIAIFTSLWHIIYIQFRIVTGIPFLATHLLLMSIIVFLTSMSIKNDFKSHIINATALLLIIGTIITNVYLYLDASVMWTRAGRPSQTDFYMSIIVILITLEATRRAYGMLFFILGAGTVAYGMFGHVLPGILGHGGMSTTRLFTGIVFPDLVGVYGTLLNLSATLITIFVIFGIALQYLGGAEFFGDMAKRLAGGFRSGPAQVSVVSSGFLAMLSGSAIANAASTGSFTIPLMQRAGYSDDISAAIESAASIGGQITPPIMGASAFIIAAYIGESYLFVIAAATIPAFFHYFTVMLSAHVRAVKFEFQPLTVEGDMPTAQSLLIRGYYVIPLAIIVGVLLQGRSASLAAWYGLASLIILYSAYEVARNRNAVTKVFKRLLQALDDGSRVMAPIALLIAMIGWIVEVLTMTGLLPAISSGLVYYSGGNILILLFMVSVLAIAFSLGLPTLPAYLLVAIVAAPAMTQVGVEPIAAHLFVLYFAVLGAVTPPGAPTCLVTAGISRGNFIPICFQSMRLSMVVYLLPFMWVYNLAILGFGTPFEIAFAIVTLLVLVVAAIGVFEKYLFTDLNVLERAILAIIIIGLIYPSHYVSGAAMAVFAILMVVHISRAKIYDFSRINPANYL